MAKISSIDGASRSQSVLQTFKFTIYSIIVHYKYRVFPNLYELGGQKFFLLASLANSLFCTLHYGTRGAASVQGLVHC